MTTLQQVVLIAHTVIALLIIALVLLQRGKGADAGAGFGAGASGTVFGARGSSTQGSARVRPARFSARAVRPASFPGRRAFSRQHFSSAA
jgi:protein translocase SecG subunit